MISERSSLIRLPHDLAFDRLRLALMVAGIGMAGLAAPARADLRLCNDTAGRIGVAIGYQDAQGWATEGWWNLAAQSCETLLRGNVPSRYVYVYAVDYDRGGEWSGAHFMCTEDKSFRIRDNTDCEFARAPAHRLHGGRHHRYQGLGDPLRGPRVRIKRALP